MLLLLRKLAFVFVLVGASLACASPTSDLSTTTTTATTTTTTNSQQQQFATTTSTTTQANPSAVVLDDQLIPDDNNSLPVVVTESPGAKAERTSVKKELEATTTATTATTALPEVLSQLAARAGESLPEMVSLAASQQQVASPVQANMSPELTGRLSDLAAQVRPELIGETFEKTIRGMNATSSDDSQIDSLLPKGTSLFKADAIDATQLSQMDCHLRNVDYCLVGLAGSSARLLPETNDELETRCDEMKATTSCLAVYNKRCQTFKIFSLLAPFINQNQDSRGAEAELIPMAEQQRALIQSARSEVRLSAQLETLLMNRAEVSSQPAANITLGNLMDFCEPHARKSHLNVQLRQRLFTLAKCINSRIPKLNPCLEDLKTAFQIFYEPKRILPLKPTCCALARFRSCSSSALDKVCGLSSFQQLLESLSSTGKSSSASPIAMLSSLDRVCRQATDHKSAYCTEVLPPGGMRAPQRRGHKASKLAKALDLFSFAPATQDLTPFEG